MIKEKRNPHIGLVTDLTTGQIDGKIHSGWNGFSYRM